MGSILADRLSRSVQDALEMEKGGVREGSVSSGPFWVKLGCFLPLQGGLPSGSDGKESACNARDMDSVPVLGRSPGEGHGNPLQCSCLENPVGRGAWWAIVHGVAKSRAQVSTQTLQRKGRRESFAVAGMP